MSRSNDTPVRKVASCHKHLPNHTLGNGEPSSKKKKIDFLPHNPHFWMRLGEGKFHSFLHCNALLPCLYMCHHSKNVSWSQWRPLQSAIAGPLAHQRPPSARLRKTGENRNARLLPSPWAAIAQLHDCDREHSRLSICRQPLLHSPPPLCCQTPRSRPIESSSCLPHKSSQLY